MLYIYKEGESPKDILYVSNLGLHGTEIYDSTIASFDGKTEAFIWICILVAFGTNFPDFQEDPFMQLYMTSMHVETPYLCTCCLGKQKYIEFLHIWNLKFHAEPCHILP